MAVMSLAMGSFSLPRVLRDHRHVCGITRSCFAMHEGTTSSKTQHRPIVHDSLTSSGIHPLAPHCNHTGLSGASDFPQAVGLVVPLPTVPSPRPSPAASLSSSVFLFECHCSERNLPSRVTPIHLLTSLLALFLFVELTVIRKHFSISMSIPCLPPPE